MTTDFVCVLLVGAVTSLYLENRRQLARLILLETDVKTLAQIIVRYSAERKGGTP